MARKGENIYKRKDGRWEGRYIVSYFSDGKAKYSSVYGRTYSEVKEKLIRAKATKEVKCSNSPKTKIPFCMCALEWLDSKKLSVKESTFKRYQNMIQQHIEPYFRSICVNKISNSTVEEFVRYMLTSGRIDGKGGLSSKTVADIVVVLKEIIKFSQYRGINIECNMALISLKKTAKEMRVLSISEEKKLVSVLQNEMDRSKMGVYLCLFTGIRIGELCALQWKDISFDDNTLKIGRTLQRLQCAENSSLAKTKIIITEPKSPAASRCIPLPDFLVNTIKPFAGAPQSYILSGSSKKVIEPRTMQNHFKKYLAESEVECANFHSLRHTFATRCVEIGFEIKTLSEILGHSSVKITLDKYVHSSMEQKKANMKKLDGIF